MTKSRNRAVFGVLFLVLLFFIVLMVFASYTISAFQAESGGLSDPRGQIAVVKVEGVIMDSKETIELLHRAEKAKDVKAIIVRVNSPGGAVGPTQEIYQEIRRIDGAYQLSLKQAESEKDKDIKYPVGTEPKPIYASFGALAASGGYYIGSATRKIFANPGTMTGSIGVIMQFVDMSKLYEFVKINPQTIKSGKYKDIGQPTRPLTREERELMKGMLNGVREQFKNDILFTRKGLLKRDIEELAQGQIFTGELAHEYGLVDELGGLWYAGRSVYEELGLKGEFNLRFIEKNKKLSLWDIMEGFDTLATNLGFKGWVDGAPLLMFKL